MDFSAVFEGVLLENRYRIDEYLAEGGFGAVFRAEQQVLGIPMRRVAVKITKATNITAAATKEILADAIILAQVMDEISDSDSRRYLVPIYDVGILPAEFDRRAFIVMEFVSGKPLRTKIERYKRMSQETCLRYIRQICLGLTALHNLPSPVVHRDLKPENVLLTKTDEVRIVDFGLAARIERELGYVAGAAGTEGYMSPETSIRLQSSCASDVYSLGVMMYEMLSGGHPFAHLIPPPNYAESAVREWLFREKERNAPQSLRAVNNTVEPWLNDVVMKCLEFRDYQRYQTAGQLLAALDSPRDAGDGGLDVREGLLTRGKTLCAAQQWEAAETALAQGVRVLPLQQDKTQFELHYQLALALLEQNKQPDAVEQIRKAEDLNDTKCFLTTKRELAEFYRGIAEACEHRNIVYMAVKYRNLEKKTM